MNDTHLEIKIIQMLSDVKQIEKNVWNDLNELH